MCISRGVCNYCRAGLDEAVLGSKFVPFCADAGLKNRNLFVGKGLHFRERLLKKFVFIFDALRRNKEA